MRPFPRLLEKQCFVRGVGPAQALCRIREMKSPADPELVSLGPWLRSALDICGVGASVPAGGAKFLSEVQPGVNRILSP